MPPNPSKTKAPKSGAKGKPKQPRPMQTRFELALLVGRAIALPEFQQKFKTSPVEAAKELDGIKLSKNDLEAIAEIDWAQVDPLISQLRALLPPPASMPPTLGNNAGW